MISAGAAPGDGPGRGRRPGGHRRTARRAWLIASTALAALLMVSAIAALLNVTAPGVGAGSVVTAGCDANGLTATPMVSYSPTTGGYVVDQIALAGVANSCRNGDFSVSLVGAAGLLATSSLPDVPLSSFGGTTNNNTLSLSFTGASPRVKAVDVTSIHVAISD